MFNEIPTESILMSLAKSHHPVDYEEELEWYIQGLVWLNMNRIKDIKEEYVVAEAAWQDNTESPTLEAEMRLHGIRFRLSVRLESADLDLCMIQLFNVPKMFCWPMFGFNQVRIDRAARHGVELIEKLTGTRVPTKDDPVKKPAENAKKDTKKMAPRGLNLDHFTALLAEYLPHFTKLLEDAQAINNSINEEDIRAPRLPELNTILAHGVVVDVPEHVVQSISDIVFLLDEMNATRPDVTGQRDTVSNLLKAARASEKAFWEKAKDHLDQKPEVAQYGFSRRSFLALFTLWRREELKAFDYVDEHGLAEKLEPRLRHRLGWLPDRRDREEEEKAWQLHVAQLNEALPSVEELVMECEEAWAARSTRGP